MTTRVFKTLTVIEVNNGIVQCTPDDGHVRAPAGTVLEWASQGQEFTLSFEQLGGGGPWPFQEKKPEVFEPTTFFRGTLAATDAYPPPAYKYTVRIRDKVLDPIIIVDK